MDGIDSSRFGSAVFSQPKRTRARNRKRPVVVLCLFNTRPTSECN